MALSIFKSPESANFFSDKFLERDGDQEVTHWLQGQRENQGRDGMIGGQQKSRGETSASGQDETQKLRGPGLGSRCGVRRKEFPGGEGRKPMKGNGMDGGVPEGGRRLMKRWTRANGR